jgi:hypothetical protein
LKAAFIAFACINGFAATLLAWVIWGSDLRSPLYVVAIGLIFGILKTTLTFRNADSRARIEGHLRDFPLKLGSESPKEGN